MSDPSTASTLHQNLPPRDYAQFVGRQRELAEVRRLLHPRSRPYLVTVDGIGGIGKSALALEAAYAYLDPGLPASERYEALVWLSAKNTVLTTEGIQTRTQQFKTLSNLFAAIAQTLDYPAITQARADEQRAIVEQLLAERRTLLILDNLETVDDEDLLDFLRELPPPTKALITTRHRIDNAFPLALTGMPEADAHALIEQEAGRKGVTSSVELREQLWARTGGMPLAIVWSIGLIAQGQPVETVLRQLGSGQSDIIDFCFTQSLAHIRGRDAYSLFLAASRFADDVSREALGIVAGLQGDQHGIERGLEELVRLSLLNKYGDRYSLLTLTRALLQAEAQRELLLVADMTERWIAYYDQFVDEFSGWSRDWEGHRRVERELTNIFAVYHHLVDTLQYIDADERHQRVAPESMDQASRLLRLFDRVARTCRIRGFWSLLEVESVSALRISRSIGSKVTGWICYLLARVAQARRDYSTARRWAQEMAEYGLQHQISAMISRAYLMLGLIALAQSRPDEAETLLTTAWAYVQPPYGDGGRSNVLAGLAELAAQRGDYEQALAQYQRAVEYAVQKDDQPKLARYRHSLGITQIALSQRAAGRANLEESLALSEESGWLNGVCVAALALAPLSIEDGDLAQARQYAERAHDGFRRLGMPTEQQAAAQLLEQIGLLERSLP